VPLIRWWRVPPRIWFIAALLLPYLAGWGAQLLAEQPPGRRSARLSVVGLLGGGLTCGLFSTITLAPPLKLTAALGLFALPAVALVMLLAIFGKLAPRALMALFTLVVAADVLWMDRTLIEGRSEQEWLEPYRELADYLKADGAVRIYSPSYSLPQQAGIYWEIPQFGGVDPFQFTTYQQAAEAATGVYAGGYSVTIPAYKGDLSTANQGAPINPELLGRWLVTHVLSDFEIKAEGLTLETRIGKVYVYRNTLAPEVNLTWDGPNRVSVRAKTPYQGSLYAVAAGRWKQAGHSPGLPGEADGSTQEWTFQYDPSEVWISLSIGSVMLVLACVGWWMKRHV
jgi:hypothetical protein